MKIFGWKSAGRALARPGKTYVPLTRPFGARWFGGGGGLGEWPQSYQAQLREGYGDKIIVDQKPHDWPELTEADLSTE